MESELREKESFRLGLLFSHMPDGNGLRKTELIETPLVKWMCHKVLPPHNINSMFSASNIGPPFLSVWFCSGPLE